MDHLLQAPRHLGAPLRVQPTLEHRELQPVTVAVHQAEHPPPAPLVGDVVGDDIEPFLDHGGSPHPVMRVVVDLACEVARQEPRLHRQ